MPNKTSPSRHPPLPNRLRARGVPETASKPDAAASPPAFLVLSVLAATEHRSPRFRSEHGEKLTGYRIFLTRKAPGGYITVGIHRNLGHSGATLHRLGDFDRDGLPDLLLDDVGESNTAATSLYLSQHAAPGRMLKQVGSFVTTGC